MSSEDYAGSFARLCEVVQSAKLILSLEHDVGIGERFRRVERTALGLRGARLDRYGVWRSHRGPLRCRARERRADEVRTLREGGCAGSVSFVRAIEAWTEEGNEDE